MILTNAPQTLSPAAVSQDPSLFASQCWWQDSEAVSHRHGWWLCSAYTREKSKQMLLRLEDASWWVISWNASYQHLDPGQLSRDASRIALDRRVAFVVFACCAVAGLSGFPQSRYRVRLRPTVERFFSGVSYLILCHPATPSPNYTPTETSQRWIKEGLCDVVRHTSSGQRHAH